MALILEQSKTSLNELSLSSLPSVEILCVEPPSTAVTQLLESNDAPDSVQLATIRERLRKADEVLRQLHATEVDPDCISSRLEGVAAIVQTHKRVLHPIRRIPAEILVEICSYCIERVDMSSFSDSLGIDSLDTKLAPWSLAQVCQFWRSVIVGAPQLWSSITLKPQSRHAMVERQATKEANASKLLSRRLTWTRSCTLDVAIKSIEPCHPLLPLLCSHSPRWKTVILSVGPKVFLELALIKGRLSALQELYIHAWLQIRINWAIDVFESAPKLISAVTHNISPVFPVSLPWAQLKDWHDGSKHHRGDVSKCDTTTNSVLDVLAECNNLINMETTCERQLSPLYKCQPVRHICLQTLTISWSSPKGVEQLLGLATLPVLTQLTVYAETMDQSPGLSMRSVWKLIQRSECSLVYLRLYGFDADIEQDDTYCRALLTSTVSLKVLSFSDINNPLIRGLLLSAPDSLEPPERMLLPNLRTFAITGKCPPSLDQLLLVEMLESRVKYGRLKEAEIKSSFVLDHQQAVARFDDLVQTRSRIGNRWISYFK